MLRKILLLAILIISLFSCKSSSSHSHNSQNEVKSLNIHKINGSTFIVNSEIIINPYLISEFSIDEIKTIKGYTKSEKYPILSEYQISFIETDKKFDFFSQENLNRQNGMNKNSPVYLDGFLLTNRNFKIAKKSIIEIEIIDPDKQNKLKQRVLNIWTLRKEDRILDCLDCLGKRKNDNPNNTD